MLADILEDTGRELSWRGASVLVGLVLGGLIAGLFSLWRRRRERRRIERGDARDTVVIEHHIVEAVEETDPDTGRPRKRPAAMRIRALGQSELCRVVPNGHLAAELLHRAFCVTPTDTLISMEGAEGSFMLETLTGFVCDRTANAPFAHDLYVMAPCCEPAELAHHQPIVIILIAVADLMLFESWPLCRGVQVEHGSDGARVLTLLEMARRFKSEQGAIAQMRKAGHRTKWVETMYVLDLPLDKRTASLPTKEVPWGRFEEVLKQMNLE
jgi:hypothetical protein